MKEDKVIVEQFALGGRNLKNYCKDCGQKLPSQNGNHRSQRCRSCNNTKRWRKYWNDYKEANRESKCYNPKPCKSKTVTEICRFGRCTFKGSNFLHIQAMLKLMHEWGMCDA